MDDGLDERIDAVERAITDGHSADGLTDAARMERRLDDLEATVDDVDDRLADLEAAVQALRGFAGGVRAVDEEVERRANAAVARVDRLEAELREHDAGTERGGADATAADGRAPSDATAVGDPGQTADGVAQSAEAASSREPGRTDATLAAAAAEAAEAVDHPEAERAGTDGEAGSLADRIRRLL
jgi:hypothetical protein